MEHWAQYDYGTRHKEIRFWESAVHKVSYLVHYKTLLQNARDISKCDSYFITKYDKDLLQNESSVLLQNATFYYKLQQLLQSVSVLLQNATFITKCVGTSINV